MNHNQKQRDKWIISQLSKIPKGCCILDVGAGSSPYRKYCKHLRYYSQDFCQLDSNQLRGRQYAKHDYVCDVLSIPIPDKKYDAILCTEALEHFPEPIKAVQEMARILKPSGRIILTAPLGSGLHQKPYHYYGGFTSFWYNHFLEKAGFEDIVCSPAGGFFFWYAQESERTEVYLRKGIDIKYQLLGYGYWILFGLLLRFVIAPLFRKIDSPSNNINFTIGYHVTATKKHC